MTTLKSGDAILVTGGAGYIGTTLVPLLLDRNCEVRVLDVLMFGDEPIAGFLKHPNLTMIAEDFRRPDRVAEAMSGVDTVVHLGAIVGDQACSLDEDLAYEVNVAATRMIAETACNHGVRRFINASTCSVYGASSGIVDECSVASPASAYTQGKLTAEKMLLEMAAPDYAPVSLRFATVYGPSHRMRFDLVVNLFIIQALKESSLVVYGGDQWRPLIHIQDAAQAILRAIEAPPSAVAGQIFNVGSNDENYQIATIAKMAQQLVVGTRVVVDNSFMDSRSYRVDFSKIKTVLGFSREWELKRGMQEMAKTLGNGALRDYRDSLYDNAKHLALNGISLSKLPR